MYVKPGTKYRIIRYRFSYDAGSGRIDADFSSFIPDKFNEKIYLSVKFQA